MAKKMINGVHYTYLDLSDKHVCGEKLGKNRQCRKPIKQRLVLIKQTPPTRCYYHYIRARMRTQANSARS